MYSKDEAHLSSIEGHLGRREEGQTCSILGEDGLLEQILSIYLYFFMWSLFQETLSTRKSPLFRDSDLTFLNQVMVWVNHEILSHPFLRILRAHGKQTSSMHMCWNFTCNCLCPKFLITHSTASHKLALQGSWRTRRWFSRCLSTPGLWLFNLRVDEECEEAERGQKELGIIFDIGFAPFLQESDPLSTKLFVISLLPYLSPVL